MFSSQRPAPKPAVTVEETEIFLNEQMALITEAKGVDPESFSLLKNKDRWTTEECKRAIANEIKWALDQNQRRLGQEVALTITEANKKSAAHAIVDGALKKETHLLL
jgi:hypothetical protein